MEAYAPSSAVGPSSLVASGARGSGEGAPAACSAAAEAEEVALSWTALQTAARKKANIILDSITTYTAMSNL